VNTRIEIESAAGGPPLASRCQGRADTSPESIVERMMGSPWRKLKPHQRQKIVFLFKEQGLTCSQLAKRFGIHPASVLRIVSLEGKNVLDNDKRIE